MRLNPLLQTDFYKIVHKESYKEGLEYLTSYWTARKSRVENVDKIVFFGLQGIIKEKLIEDFEENFFKRPIEEILKEYEKILKNTMPDNRKIEEGKETLRELHKLGYLPIEIRALAEGLRVPIGVPLFEITNTVKGYGWLVNYLETYISCNIWLPITSATTSYRYREIVEKYYNETVENNELKKFALGDFSMRGMTSVDSAIHSTAGHLTSFIPTATIPGILWTEKYYNENIEEYLVGSGIPSMEHSVMSSYGREGEFESYKHLLEEVFPKGKLSIVSDTYNYWKVLTDYLPKLKDTILKREGTLFVRGDSGDPVDIIAGMSFDSEDRRLKEILRKEVRTLPLYSENKEKIEILVESYKSKEINLHQLYDRLFCETERFFRNEALDVKVVDWKIVKKMPKETNFIDMAEEGYLIMDTSTFNLSSIAGYKGTVEILWEIFGGTINKKGYKVLDPHIRAIYGDSITPERAKAIYSRLQEKGFSAENVVLGIGSYTYQFVTRDTYGFALKATHSVINGEERLIYKDPITDKGNFKKSQKGKCVVLLDENTKEITYKDNLTIKEKESLKGKDLLRTIFKNSKMTKEESFREIRERLHEKKF